VVIWYIFPILACFDQEKSGNPVNLAHRKTCFAKKTWQTHYLFTFKRQPIANDLFREADTPFHISERYCGNDGKVSRSDNLYLMLTESNPKQY
jgi:hypothetical protein